MIPSTDSLKECFAFLDEHRFHRTDRLPVVAARQWKVAWEARALRRFKKGEPNIHEVAVPALYWYSEYPAVRKLFFALTLGREDDDFSGLPQLQALYPHGTGRPSWPVVSRFGRYILLSPGSLVRDEGDDVVYFGEDTLFLMGGCQALLDKIQASGPEPVACLDLCCGGGGIGLALPPFEGSVLGIDLNPQAIALAEAIAQAQALTNYNYECCDVQKGWDGNFDLVFGNPPTISPTLGDSDQAADALETFRAVVLGVVKCLTDRGRALLTVFSEVTQDGDLAYEAVKSLLSGRRGYRYFVRREYALGGGRILRHCVLELFTATETIRHDFVPSGTRGLQLPTMEWRLPK